MFQKLRQNPKVGTALCLVAPFWQRTVALCIQSCQINTQYWPGIIGRRRAMLCHGRVHTLFSACWNKAGCQEAIWLLLVRGRRSIFTSVLFYGSLVMFCANKKLQTTDTAHNYKDWCCTCRWCPAEVKLHILFFEVFLCASLTIVAHHFSWLFLRWLFFARVFRVKYWRRFRSSEHLVCSLFGVLGSDSFTLPCAAPNTVSEEKIIRSM